MSNNRIIKFRAWDTKRNRMWSPEEMGQDELTINPNGRGFVNVSGDSTTHSQYMTHLIPLQFTGLHDKAGREIYEGDIVYNPNDFGCTSSWGDVGDRLPDKRIVVWNQDEAAFKWDFADERIRGRGCSGYILCKTGESLFEVIGNIYENPDLLSMADRN